MLKIKKFGEEWFEKHREQLNKVNEMMKELERDEEIQKLYRENVTIEKEGGEIMGQRLNIEIKSKNKVIANCYYHWSGYSLSSLKLTKKHNRWF